MMYRIRRYDVFRFAQVELINFAEVSYYNRRGDAKKVVYAMTLNFS